MGCHSTRSPPRHREGCDMIRCVCQQALHGVCVRSREIATAMAVEPLLRAGQRGAGHLMSGLLWSFWGYQGRDEPIILSMGALGFVQRQRGSPSAAHHPSWCYLTLGTLCCKHTLDTDLRDPYMLPEKVQSCSPQTTPWSSSTLTFYL